MHLRTFVSFLSVITTAVSQNVPVVNTTSGLLRGFSPFPDVQAYLGIPYAEPPIGDLRFAPPQPFKPKNASPRNCYYSTPGCFQLNYLTAFSDRSTGIAESENMMSINIWKPATHKKPLPVMIFLYGGGFTEGANALPQYSGLEFVSEQKDIIFASINYRVNIFGFPNSPAIKTKNPGLLDQRLGVEWLRDNIHAFGGDSSRMVLAGHSAGAQSISYWSFAYAKDPIVSGFIEFSGQPETVSTDDGSSWTAIANSTGCQNSNAKTELECMRKVEPRELKRAMSPNNMPDLSSPVIGGGTPAVDNVTVFTLDEYASRGKAGKFAKLPLLVSNTHNEGDGILPFSPINGVNKTLSDELTLELFHCPVAAAASYWSAYKVPTWRYLYKGTFAATIPYPWMRPYHGSDLELVLAQERSAAYQAIEKELKKAGKYIRDAVASFVRDPRQGLEQFGWKVYDLVDRHSWSFSVQNLREWNSSTQQNMTRPVKNYQDNGINIHVVDYRLSLFEGSNKSSK